MSLRILCISIFALAACRPDANPAVALAHPDFDYFACAVHPKLQAGCAMPACHGSEQTAMRVHSPGLLRMPPPDGGPLNVAYRNGAPLDRAELTADYNSLRALIDPNDVEASAPLRKPLAQAAGGGWHGGGQIYYDKTDPTYGAILAWAKGATVSSLSQQDQQECQRVLSRSLSQ